MMVEARRQQQHSPVRAAVTAQLAVGDRHPGRRAGAGSKILAEIRLGFNLNKPDGPKSQYWLSFPDYDVKNRMKLEYPLEDFVTPLIDEYVHDFRATLMRGRDKYLHSRNAQGAQGKSHLQRTDHGPHHQADRFADYRRTSSATPSAP